MIHAEYITVFPDYHTSFVRISPRQKMSPLRISNAVSNCSSSKTVFPSQVTLRTKILRTFVQCQVDGDALSASIMVIYKNGIGNHPEIPEAVLAIEGMQIIQ